MDPNRISTTHLLGILAIFVVFAAALSFFSGTESSPATQAAAAAQATVKNHDDIKALTGIITAASATHSQGATHASSNSALNGNADDQALASATKRSELMQQLASDDPAAFLQNAIP